MKPKACQITDKICLEHSKIIDLFSKKLNRKQKDLME